MAENKIDSETSTVPADQPEAPAGITLGVIKLIRVKLERSLGNRRISDDLGGVSPGLISAWLNGQKRVMGVHRPAIKKAYGIEPDLFDRMPPKSGEPPADASSGDSSSSAATLSAARPDVSALEEMQAVLDSITQRLGEPDLPMADQSRLLGLKVSAITKMGQMTGELDQTDLQKFRRSLEYQDLVRRLVGAVSSFPGAELEVTRVLGHAVDNVRTVSAAGPLGFAELREYCGYAENYVSVDDLAPAFDHLVYPIGGRERELVQADRALAKRILDAINKGDPAILTSKIAYSPVDTYRREVATTLEFELAREEKFAAFERDFGRVACERARELS